MASKSKRRRKVLGASCILAALIIAGSSFAWFTSSDEVTNRLSASANYGVAIAEDFTPPENWLPGQKVDKNVGVVNTGNVDAFVRTWLEGEMKVTAEKRDTAKLDIASGATQYKQFKDGSTVVVKEADVIATSDGKISGAAVLKKETDANFIENNLTYYYTDGGSKKVSLRELSKKELQNPNISSTATTTSPDAYSEVMSVQAGGELVYASNAAVSFKVTPNQTLSFKSKEGDTYDVVGGNTYTVVVDADVKRPAPNATVGTEINVSGTTITVKDLDALYKYLGDNIDTNTFKPMATGLYIFRRNVAVTGTSGQNPIAENFEFSGYYYVKATTTDNGGDGIYFALQYTNNETASPAARSEYVLPKSDTVYTYLDTENTGKYVFTPGADLALYTAQQKVVGNSDLTWIYQVGTLSAGVEVEDNGVVYKYNGTNWLKPDNTALDSSVAAEKAIIDKLNASVLPATLTANYYGAENGAVKTALANSGTAFTADTEVDTAIAGANTNTYDDIVIQVNLKNIGTAPEKWTAVAQDTDTIKTDQRTFYYNNDVEEGATTSKLVDSLELSSSTKKQAYLAFDFDLNVFMESMQVTIDDNGKEAYESVTSWGPTASTSNTGATGANVASTQTGSEIESIAWTYSAT